MGKGISADRKLVQGNLGRKSTARNGEWAGKLDDAVEGQRQKWELVVRCWIH